MGVERGVYDNLERAPEDVGRRTPLLPLLLLPASHIRQNRDHRDRRRKSDAAVQRRFSRFDIWGLPFMTSALEGGGGPQKADKRNKIS